MSLPPPLSPHDLATADAQAMHAATDDYYGQFEVAKLRASLDNRKRFNEQALQELAASIKTMGVAQAILIRPVTPTAEAPEPFEIVAGERRFRASKIAGKTHIPALCRKLSDLDAAKIRILENLQREDPHPIEEAEGYQLLMQQHGYDADQLADEIKKSRSYIYGRLKLCALTQKARDACFDDKISASIALLIARIPVKSLQEKCLDEVVKSWNGPMSYRTAAQHVESNYMLNLKKATFSTTDAELLPAAGSCKACPKRAGNQPEVFTDVNADVCTDPICYKAKGEAHVIRVKRLAMESGMTVVSGADAKKVMPDSYGDLKGGYVAVDKPIYSDTERRSLRQILGKQLPALTLLQSPHNGEMVYIARQEDVSPLLEAKGLNVPAPQSSHREREKEQEAKAKLEREYRKRLFQATHHASLMMNLVDLDLRLIAMHMFDSLPWGTIPTKILMETYGWTEDMFGYPRKEKMRTAIDGLTPAQLNQFIRDCSLCRDLDVMVYTDTSTKPENLLAFAERTKVDAKKIRGEVLAEAKAKADKKKKPGAKKAGTTVAPAPAPAPLEKEVAPMLQTDLVDSLTPAADDVDEHAAQVDVPHSDNDVEEITGASAGVVRYRNPKDPMQTWTGRGKQPRWVRDWVESGKSLDELHIPSAAVAANQTVQEAAHA
jgi:ParB/RepB/Spo0J family partition protein